MNILFVLLLIVFNIFFLNSAYKKHKTKSKRILLVLLYLIHVVSLFVFYSFTNLQGVDSYIFFQRAVQSSNILEFLYPGSKFISFLIYPLVKIGLSYFSISALFSTFSLAGFSMVMSIIFNRIEKLTNNNLLLFLALMLLMPTLHFWTAGLTKEAILFFLLVHILNLILTSKSINYLIFILLFFILGIRPYLFFILLFCYIIHGVLNYKLSTIKKGLLIISFIIVSISASPIIKFFLKVENLNYQTYTEVLKKIAKYSSNSGNSSINLETSNYFERLFLVTSRPLFFDSKTFFQLIVSIENACFIVLIAIFLYKYIKGKLKLEKSFFFIYAAIIFIILFLSLYMYNLGLASRMRIMYIPYLIFIMFISEVKILEHERKIN